MSDSVSFPGFQASLGFMIIEYTPAWDDLKWPPKKVRNMGWLMALGFPHYRNWTHRIEYNSPWQAPWLIEAPLRHHWGKKHLLGTPEWRSQTQPGFMYPSIDIVLVCACIILSFCIILSSKISKPSYAVHLLLIVYYTYLHFGAVSRWYYCILHIIVRTIPWIPSSYT